MGDPLRLCVDDRVTLGVDTELPDDVVVELPDAEPLRVVVAVLVLVALEVGDPLSFGAGFV
jgi:hypothetical protein